MIAMALNHMTVAQLGFAEMVDMAARLGFAGIEVRNDLQRPLFDGMTPEEAGAMIRDRGLRLLALAEVKRFNDWSDDKAAEALALMKIARAAGAEAVSLIPRNDNKGMGNGERQAAVRVALRALRPMLEDHGLIGLVEPLGFATCPVRYKSEAVEAIEAVGGTAQFKLVHDTFHHTLAGGGPFYAEQTGLIHVSGVVAPEVSVDQMQDAHRILVDGRDRLGNLDQIAALLAANPALPVSFEAFAPEVHASATAEADLVTSTKFIRDHLSALAA
jgi:2-keto-myo-inositol isomerase